ncbi:MAG TPA: hypothetical protein VGX92_14895 [Pyrinomonadaceae bacterium]|jgi:hypothetical protein|nr:hypothetical protein [Pyrinomonadaceae bacterium]
MADALSKLWDFLWRPLLPFEARVWVYLATFIAFALLPLWLIAYAKYAGRNKR